MPTGAHETQTANGSVVRTRANGTRSDVHDAKRGMDIHHGLNGNRRVSVERADDSRVVAERGGRGGYVQHPYTTTDMNSAVAVTTTMDVSTIVITAGTTTVARLLRERVCPGLLLWTRLLRVGVQPVARADRVCVGMGG